jgi:hypothetical protein
VAVVTLWGPFYHYVSPALLPGEDCGIWWGTWDVPGVAGPQRGTFTVTGHPQATAGNEASLLLSNMSVQIKDHGVEAPYWVTSLQATFVNNGAVPIAYFSTYVSLVSGDSDVIG